MKTRSFQLATAALALALFTQVPSVDAQDATPPAAPQAGGAPTTGGGGNVDRMEQFRQRMNERIKAELKASDDEWSVIQPLLARVQDSMRKSMAGRFGGMGGGGRFRAGDNNNGANKDNNRFRFSSPEADALKAALDAEGSTPADIKAKLQALRESRKKAAAELEQAQEDLRKVLSQRQEAALVMMGMLQ